MSLFGSAKSYVGIDIGNSAVKMVELQNEKGKPKLLTYGYLEQNSQILTSDSKEAKAQIISSIQQIHRDSRMISKDTVAALPSYTVFTSIIRLPQVPKKELFAAVNWEAKKFVPMPLEEMVLDWKILEENEVNTAFSANAQNTQTPTGSASEAQGREKRITSKGDQKFYKILLTAAPKQLVTRYLEIFKEAGLNLVSLETESFALERSLVGKDKSPVMIIDIGAVATTISIVLDSVPLINRSIDMGGFTITKSIANSLHIDLEMAEQFKRDFGLNQQSTASSAGGSNGGNQIPQRIEFMISSIMNEIKYVMNLYQTQGNATVEKIILAGGSAWLPNIAQHLSQSLQKKVYIGDPWARVMYPLELKPVLEQIGSRFAVSVGLAMREIR